MSEQPAQERKFDWSGGSITFRLNLCLLALAITTLFPAEYSYISLVGKLAWSAVLSCLVPPIVSFIVRNRYVSLTLLALYAALAIQLWRQATAIYFGSFIHRTMKSAIEWVGVVDGLALIVLVAYVGFFLLVGLIALIARWKK